MRVQGMKLFGTKMEKISENLIHIVLLWDRKLFPKGAFGKSRICGCGCIAIRSISEHYCETKKEQQYVENFD